MGDNLHIDELIATVSGFKNYIQELVGLYDQVPTLLEGDKKALAASDLSELEALGARKLAIAETIEAVFNQLNRSIQDIERSSREIPGMPRLMSPFTLSSTMEWLVKLGATLKRDGFAAQVYLHIVNAAGEMATQLLTKHNDMRPALEANRYMMEKVLAFKQESYRFWQDVANVSMSGYNSQGTQTTATTARSVLQIRA